MNCKSFILKQNILPIELIGTYQLNKIFHCTLGVYKIQKNSFQIITLWIQETTLGFEVYYLETNNLVSVYQKEYRVYFLQTFTTSVGIKVLTYPSPMAN